MAEYKKLSPEEYSSDRKVAMKEVSAKQKVIGTEGSQAKKYCYVTCVKCKKEKFTRTEVYEKRVQKAGSEEKLLSTYLCRECRKNG